MRVGCRLLLVDAVEGQHERSEASVVEARTSEGFGKLRLGFTFSIVSVVLFVLSPLGLVFSGLGFLFVALPAVYFLGIYYRASGWRLLGFGQTETLCGYVRFSWPFLRWAGCCRPSSDFGLRSPRTSL
jgi:hypothetical protein